MKNSIFDFDDYRKYLATIIAEKDGKSRGFRSVLASHIGVQRTFISQVLKGDSNFNLEHGVAVSALLGHTSEECDFFLLLIQLARAGTPALREKIQSQIRILKEKRLVLKNRFLENDSLSLEDKIEYYSSWLYGAVRVLATIPEFQSRKKIEKCFTLPVEQVRVALEFLLSRGLLKEDGGKIIPTEKHMYLGNDSRLVLRHHSNWRMRAIQSLEIENKFDLHFSAINSLSRADVELIREALVKTIEKIRRRVKDSPEEVMYVLNVDFFKEGLLS